MENNIDMMIDDQITTFNSEIENIDLKISELSQRRARIVDQRNDLVNKKRLTRSLEASSKKWSDGNFSWTQELNSTMRKVFKLHSFRSQQLKAINAYMSKQDIILVAPTGGGKSLCYQLPGVISPGLTLVISPLVSLMRDQIWALKSLDINAEMLSSFSEKSEVKIIHKHVAEGSSLKILYVTPERLANSKTLMNNLQVAYRSNRISGIAIDEVHCCSQWGHDYRPDYKFLASLKILFPDIPIIGVTATATVKVILDVQSMLNIPDCLVLRAPFNRPNLFYHVVDKPQEKDEFLNIAEKLLKTRYKNQSGIIYTFSIKDSEEIATGLLNRDCKVRAYNANLDDKTRSKTHQRWLDGSIQAVVATIAFGMGIDKPDVRFVIHHTLSKSIENYYQESGRAGRDGEYAECLLFYRFADMFKITSMVFTEHCGLANAYSMIKYCIDGKSCRRDILSKYFSEVWNEDHCNEKCDRCKNRQKYSPKEIDVRPHLADLLLIIERAEKLNVRLTGLKLVDAWYKKGEKTLRVPEMNAPKLDRHYGEQIVTFLIMKNFLKEDFHYTAYSTISYLKKGSMKLGKDEKIEFQGARVLELHRVESEQNNDESIENGSVSSKSSKTKKKSRSSSSAKKRRKNSCSELDLTLEEIDDDLIVLSQSNEVIELD